MTKVVLYHNPGCSKSRGALALLEPLGLALDVVEYLKAPLSRAELETLLDQLGGSPGGLVRKDKHFKELGLDPSDYEDREAVAQILSEHPRLMERPIAVADGRAVIGRPPERVLELIG
ncbi:MAG TPA: arsenate reductase (glutaredoxin) [Myxococcales bacterium]|jgi:arsenate reductase|nr:arsenate reductase (glutaredoxin) [Myxococcales bacterium]HIL02662.1 arsenate reductase (glutaredoxin) [Myxococcales bacterium]